MAVEAYYCVRCMYVGEDGVQERKRLTRSTGRNTRTGLKTPEMDDGFNLARSLCVDTSMPGTTFIGLMTLPAMVMERGYVKKRLHLSRPAFHSLQHLQHLPPRAWSDSRLSKFCFAAPFVPFYRFCESMNLDMRALYQPLHVIIRKARHQGQVVDLSATCCRNIEFVDPPAAAGFGIRRLSGWYSAGGRMLLKTLVYLCIYVWYIS